MKKIFLMIIFILLSVCNFPALSEGEMREGSFEVSPFFGYCTGSTSRDLCHKDVYGLRLGYTLTPTWEIEGAFEGVGTSAATMYHADLLYHFMPEKSLNPFLIAGIGVAHVRPVSGSPYDTVMGNFGIGLKYWLSKNIAFRTEIRDVMTHSQNSVVTAGLTFAFGGKTAKPEPMPAPIPAPKAETKPEAKIEKSESKPEAKPKPMVKLEANPIVIEKGGSSNLTWTSKDATSLSIDQGIGDVPASGTRKVLPPETTTYTITAKNESGVTTDSATLTVREITIILEDIHFDFNKATLTAAAKKILDKNIEIIKENPGITVQIEGYACAHGSAAYNMILSERRVNTVKEYLVKQGISGERLTTIAYGETRLAVPEIPTKKNKNSKEAKANRRVHFEVIMK